MLAGSILAAGTAFLLLCSDVAAKPTFHKRGSRPKTCKLTLAQMNLGSAATNLTTDGLKPLYAAIGVGQQLYNCSTAGAWISNGAVADLFDASAVTSTSVLDRVTSAVAKMAQANPALVSAALTKAGNLPFPQIGKHTFVQTPGSTTPGAISPKFDLSSAAGGALAAGNPSFFIGAKAASSASPDGPQNVAWLKLSNVQGTLAKAVYRIHTVSGNFPAGTCKAGTQTQVPYAAQYWFLA